MKVKPLFLVTVILFGLLLNACGSPQVNETAVSENTVAEEIYINNCGNPASAEQTSEHSQTVTIEGGAELGFEKIAKGSVEAKYVSTSGIVKSQKVTAAPNTNMKFVLLWKEKVSEGTVTATGHSGQATYRVSVPISVEQASAEVLDCQTPGDLPPSTASPATGPSSTTDLTALIQAAKSEGILNTIALPHDWCNYGEAINAFKAKYGLQVNELSPDVGSAEEIEAIKAGSNSQSPDVIDVGLAWAYLAKSEGLLAPYKVSTWDTIPTPMKDSDGYWYGDYYGVIAFLVNINVQPNVPQDWSDLRKPEYRGQVALSGNPRTSNQAYSSVIAAALANGGSLDNVRPGLDFFTDLNQVGNLLPVMATNDTVKSGETPVRITWDYNALAAHDALPDTQVVIPASGRVGYLYAQAISANSPHPNAAKLWMEFLYSDEGQLLWMKGYCHPVREGDLYARGKVPLNLSTKVANLSGIYFPSPDQFSAAKELITSNWDTLVGVDIR